MVKVKLRFVDTLNFHADKYMTHLESRVEVLEKEIERLNNVIQKNETKIRHIEALNINLIHQNKLDEHNLQKLKQVKKLEQKIFRLGLIIRNKDAAITILKHGKGIPEKDEIKIRPENEREKYIQRLKLKNEQLSEKKQEH
jgi:uncharacterized protein YigA (DUF484 family)